MKLATFNFPKKFVNQHLYIQRHPKNMGQMLYLSYTRWVLRHTLYF
jgi:hypothetical protein